MVAGIAEWQRSYVRLYFHILDCRRQARAWLRTGGLPVAAQAMDLLNRHARNYASQQVIYMLKNRLIGELWSRREVQATVTRQLQRLPCHSCYGTGKWRSEYDGHRERCWKCGGSGVYREHWLYLFRFRIGGRTYGWHQPEEILAWRPTWTPVDPEPIYQAPAFSMGNVLNPGARDVLIATVYEYLRSVGVPANVLPYVGDLGTALRWDLFGTSYRAGLLSRLARRCRRAMDRARVWQDRVTGHVEDEIPF